MARGKKEEPKMSMMDKVCVGAAELIGTGILVFVGCMGCMSSLAGTIPHEQISFTFGLAVMFVIQIFGHISGAHLNPAVTLAAVILGCIPYILAPIYIVSQVIGAVLGFALLKAVTPGHIFNAPEIFDPVLNTTVRAVGVCSTVPNPAISSLQALTVEIVISLVLVLVCAAVWDHRNAKTHDSVSIRFGLTIAGLAMAGGPYTGASMNPARSFGPALINNDWNGHWKEKVCKLHVNSWKMENCRWGNVSTIEITNKIEENIPKNTKKAKKYAWGQFMDFSKQRNYTLEEGTTRIQLCNMVRDYAYNMKKTDGTEYKENVIKFNWNVTAKMLQEKFFKDYNVKIDPFSDLEFLPVINKYYFY